MFRKPTTKFYDNVGRVMSLADSHLLHYNVFLTRDKLAVKAVKDLVEHLLSQVFRRHIKKMFGKYV